MTDPQPQQHCDHECVCQYFKSDSMCASIDGTPCMRNRRGCKECTHDSRYRSTTTPEKCAEPDTCIHPADCPEIRKAATKARDEVLDDIMGFVKGWGSLNFQIPKKHLKKKIESLRKQEREQE